MKIKLLLFSVVFVAYSALSAQIYTLPYNQDFSGFPEDNATFGPGAEPNALVQDWINIQTGDDAQDWFGRSAATGSGGTGPTSDHTTGTGTYMFVEDGYGNNTSVQLQSPGIDLLTTTGGVGLTYWAHSQTGSALGNSMVVKASNDLTTWVTVDSFSILSATDLWVERTADLSPFTGDTVYVIWQGSNNVTSFTHDIAIDDVSMFETVLTASINGKGDVTCGGGSDGWISAGVTFGTAPFTYYWNSVMGNDTLFNTTAGTYSLIVEDAVGDSSAIVYDTLFSPTMITPYTSPLSSILCLNDSGTIFIDSVSGGNPLSLGCSLSPIACSGPSDTTSVDVGTTSVNTGTGYPAAFGNWYWGARHQFIYTAAELNAAGIMGGNIDSIGFPVTSLGTGTLTYDNYTVSMGCTSSPDLATAWETGLTTVFPAQTITVTLDTVWFAFPTPYLWNGTDNLVIETCFNNSSFTNNVITNVTNAGFTATRYFRADNGTVCGSTATTNTSTDRPNMVFGHCAATASTLDAYTYSWSTGDTAVTMIDSLLPGTYILTVYDAVGCSVTDTTVLTAIDTSTSVSNVDITANQVGATYQWIDCGNGNTVIAGATSATYTATANGNYAVIVDIAGCSDTSACVNISTVGIEDATTSLSNLQVYPNPTTGDVTITNDFTITNVSIVSITGSEVYSINNVNDKQLKVSLSEFSKGIYYVKVQGGNQLKVIKLIKQ